MGKFLRFIGILFLGLTSALIVLSGVGTICVAINPTKYDGMEAIAQYQWLYLFYVIAFIVIGVMGIRAVVQLVRGKPNAYRDVLVVLIAGIVVGAIHMTTSRALRADGSSMPLDFIVYSMVFTLLLFLIFRIPGVWEKVDFEHHADDSSEAAGGMAAIVAGFLVLSVQMWAGPTHIFDGVNLADAFHPTMMAVGSLLLLFGIGLLAHAILKMKEKETLPVQAPAME